MKFVWCAHVHLPGYMNETAAFELILCLRCQLWLASFFFHTWFDVCLSQWIKSIGRAKLLLIPPVYSLRGIRAYEELQIVVTEVGQVKQTVTVHVYAWVGDGWVTSTYPSEYRLQQISHKYIHDCATLWPNFPDNRNNGATICNLLLQKTVPRHNNILILRNSKYTIRHYTTLYYSIFKIVNVSAAM